MASSNVQHDSLSAISVGNIQCIKLQGNKKRNNYNLRKDQMICLLESQDLLGFIDGEIPPPISNPEYVTWRKRDRLVKAWILSSLTEEVMSIVVDLNSTSRYIWTELKTEFSKPDVETSAHVEDAAGKDLSWYLPLYRAALTGDWETAVKFFERDREDAKAIVSCRLETALHIAVENGKANDFVKKLLEWLPDDALALKNVFGETALHCAANVGNTEAAIMLMLKQIHPLPIQLRVPRIKGIRDKKLMHRQALQLLKSLCKLESLPDSEASLIYRDAIILAANSGVHEVVEMIIHMFPVLE
ncbi:hypothetical protein BUALT_Bualt16G0043500 [Buddleja alternifolia]|uniref:Uncharacterized protein n=1 Tax=Buddleja alternifolia TaxID=168488 RepID=A0AAV6WAK1_9LAMI|nr:hypothetical protein BUALT_Bualt16G0043500 [Buddleja alternifolia]